MKRLKSILIAQVVAVLATACTEYLDPRYVEVTQLGALVKTDTLSVTAGDCIIPVKANVNFVAKVEKGSEWLSFDSDNTGVCSRDCDSAVRDISLYSTANTGFPRMALVTLEAGGRSDTVYVKQEGKYRQFVELGVSEITAEPEGGVYFVDVDTNVPARDIFVSADKDGVDEVSYKDNVLTVSVAPNNGRNDRTINLKVFCRDEWRREIGNILIIRQKKIQ